MPKPILSALSPNVEKDDLKLAWSLFLGSKKPNKENWLNLKHKLSELLEVKEENIFLVNSGRSALYILLKALNLPKGAEILVQAFTCKALINPIIWAGYKVKFVDIKAESLNPDPEDLKRKITPKTKALILQYTFGKVENLEEILEIAKARNLILIEDLAHSLGLKYKGKPLGSFGKVSFLSFGRDKVISSVFGGALVVRDEELKAKVSKIYQSLSSPSLIWTKKQLLHPILTETLIKKAYSFSFGRILLLTLQNLGILSKALSKKEKETFKKPKNFPQKMPLELIELALNQIQKLDKFQKKRKELANFYIESLEDLKNFKILFSKPEAYLKFPLLAKKDLNYPKIFKFLAKEKIFLQDGWTQSIILPPDSKFNSIYKKDCPQAESVSKRILNLPLNPNLEKEDLERIIKAILELDKVIS